MEEIDVPKADEADIQTKTPPKPVKTSRNDKINQSTDLCIPNKWGRLLSLHPSLPHVDLVEGTSSFMFPSSLYSM
jgi:hypothetical protein